MCVFTFCDVTGNGSEFMAMNGKVTTTQGINKGWKETAVM